MCIVSINIPEVVLFDKCLTRMKAEQIARWPGRQWLCIFANMDVYIGYGLENAGMTEEEFLMFLGKNEISMVLMMRLSCKRTSTMRNVIVNSTPMIALSKIGKVRCLV